MKAIQYSQTGPSTVLTLTERKPVTPEPGQVRVRVHVSGVNPSDWKMRTGPGRIERPKVPNQDGAGVIDAVGTQVTAFSVGDRVWLWDVAFGTDEGTAQEFVTLPEKHVMPLPDGVPFDVGASLGVPALTAHIALRSDERPPRPLAAGALTGKTVLVTGGAGAVGNAAIQLAHWAGATVITTVSGESKADLARTAGADVTILYRSENVAERVRQVAPNGVDLIVDVAVAENIDTNLECLASGGTIVSYAWGEKTELSMPITGGVFGNVHLRFLGTYTVSWEEKRAALAGVQAALNEGALAVGKEAGLPITRFNLADTAAAHDAVEAGCVGKVLIDVADEPTAPHDGEERVKKAENESTPTFSDEELEAIEAFFNMAREGNKTELSAVIASGVPANLTNSKGDTFLILAAYNTHTETVEALLRAGADPNRVNDMGQTALSAATFRNDEATVRVLLNHGADPNLGAMSAVAAAQQFGLETMQRILAEYQTETET